MGWLEVKDAYDARLCLTDQSTEDKVARRILRGLGFTENSFLKQKAWLEWTDTDPDGSERGCSRDEYDRPLMDKVKIYLRRPYTTTLRNREVAVIPLPRGKIQTAIDRLTDNFMTDVPAPILIGMLNGKAMVFHLETRDRLTSMLTPPYTVVHKMFKDGQFWLIIAQETAEFFKSVRSSRED